MVGSRPKSERTPRSESNISLVLLPVFASRTLGEVSWTQKSGSPVLSMLLSFEPGVSQALHGSPTAKNSSFYFFVFGVHSASFFTTRFETYGDVGQEQ